MKLLVTMFAIMLLSNSFAQTQANTQTDVRLFAQCMISISSQAEMDALTNEMYNNPNIEMVRLDMNTQRALVITANLTQLTADEFKSWFGSYQSTVYCVQIGVQGVDAMNPYPFSNCQ